MIRHISIAVALLFAGCSAVPNIPTHPTAPSQSQTVRAASPAGGGAFSATYAGSYRLTVCASPDGDGSFKFSGLGTGSFIHHSIETGMLIGDVHQSCNWSGKVALTSRFHPQNSITMALSLRGFQSGTPCSPRFGQKVNFAVLSGTGRFARAAGSGTVVFACSNGNYTDQWSGAVTF